MILACISRGISVFQGDLDEGLRDYGSKSYDYVILNKTLQALHNPILVLREMVRVGKKGIVNFPNFGYLLNRYQLCFRGRMPVNKEIPYQWYDTPNIHFCTRKDFVALCREMNLRIHREIAILHKLRVPPPLANLFAAEVCFEISEI